MTGGPWLVVGIGIIVVVLASVMLMFAPALGNLRGRGRSGTRSAEPPPSARLPTSYAGSLMKGFGYMFGSRRRPRRRMDSVGRRFDRAMVRIDTVDPYDAQRRIGEAIMVAGLVEEPEEVEEVEPTGVATEEPMDEARGSSHE
jgi:hypothetical protein